MVLNRQQAINDDSILRCIVCITKLEWVNCSWWSYWFKNILVPCCEWDIAHVMFPWMAVRYYFPRKKVAKRKRSASSSDDEVKKKPTPGEFHFVSWNKKWKLLTHWFLWENRLIQDLVPIGNRSWPEPILTMMKFFFSAKKPTVRFSPSTSPDHKSRSPSPSNHVSAHSPSPDKKHRSDSPIPSTSAHDISDSDTNNTPVKRPPPLDESETPVKKSMEDEESDAEPSESFLENITIYLHNLPPDVKKKFTRSIIRYPWINSL